MSAGAAPLTIRALQATAVDVPMSDVLEMSSHLFPEVSAHLLAATPTCHFPEYVDWADKIMQQPLRIVDGCAVPSDQPGNGPAWDAAAVEHYRVR